MLNIYQHCVQMKLLFRFAGYVIGIEDRRMVSEDRMRKNKCIHL